MFIYFGRNYTSTARGAIIKSVACEKCGTTYFYELVRHATGQGTAAYGIGAASAARRAEAQAHKRLARRLERETETVPCPRCNWVQESMIREVRRCHLRWLRTLGITLASIILGIVALVYIILVSGKQRDFDAAVPYLIAWGAGAIVGGAALVCLRILLASRIGLNAAHPGEPLLPPGTPPALVETGDMDEQGRPLLAPARPVRVKIESGWLVWNLSAKPLVNQCCRCLAPAQKAFATPISSNHLPVPLCSGCYWRLVLHWWLWALLIIAAAIGAAFTAAYAMTGRFETAISFAIIGSFLGLLLAVTLSSTIVAPYRQRMVDPSRSIVRLKFRNPAYTQLLAESLGGEGISAALGFPVLPTAARAASGQTSLTTFTPTDARLPS